MSKNKKIQNKSKKKINKTQGKSSSFQEMSQSLSIVIPCYNEEENVNVMLSALQKFEKYHKGSFFEVLIVDDASKDNTVAKCEDTFANAFKESTIIRIIKNEENKGKGGVIQQGVELAQGDFILTLDADMSSAPIELNKWLRLMPNKIFNNEEILIADREHKDSDTEGKGFRRIAGLVFNFIIQFFTGLPLLDTQCGFKLYPKEIGKKLFSELKDIGWAHDVELLYNAKMQNIPIQPMPVKWVHNESTSKISLFSDSIKMFFQTLLISLRLNWRYFISDPIESITKKEFNKKDPLYFRLLFAVLTIILLVIMPSLSFDYGITGDEEVQKIYGELLLDYYESDGENEEALSYKNLYYYGGLFDYTAAWFNKHIGLFNEWDMRHFLNALIGFILIFFTGLTAKEMTNKWSVGFLALSFMALSPRIFGHSMNNPKDIPFAAAYIFTIYFLVKWVKQLPFISLKNILMIALGIAVAINIRVGGILLIAYFGLFTLVAMFLKEDVRIRLKDVKYLTKLGIAGIVAVILGYFGGLLFWPYGMKDPMVNPMKALSEMSSFSTGIRMLFDGTHHWSDKLPWYYIPKWFMIATPIFIILGWLFSLVFSFLKFDKKQFLPYAVIAFVAFFPPIYAIYKDSALYDGIRHFIFIYPCLVILSAWGWKELITFKDNKNIKMGASALMIVLMISPLWWMFRSHPYQYIYFNEVVGGLKGAYTNYETDYWMTSTKEATQWLINHDNKLKSSSERVSVKSNCVSPVKEYINRYTADGSVHNTGYYNFRERHKYYSNYDIFISRFTNREFLINNVYPPEHTIYTVEVDGVPLCSVSERGPGYDYKGSQAEEKKDYDTAISFYLQELQRSPKNDASMLALVRCYLNKGDYPNAKVYIDKLMSYSNTYVNALLMKGFYEIRTGDVDGAINTYSLVNKLSYKEQSSYGYLVRLKNSKGLKQEALQHAEAYAEISGRDAQVYQLGEQLAQEMGNSKLLYYFKAKNAFSKGDGRACLENINACLQIDPNYKIALDLKKALDQAIETSKQQQ